MKRYDSVGSVEQSITLQDSTGKEIESHKQSSAYAQRSFVSGSIGKSMFRNNRDYEEIIRKQFLSRTIWLTLIASLLFSAINVSLKSWGSVVVITLSAAICMAALLVSHRGHLTLASLLLCSSVLIAITYSIYDGDGLFDPGIVGYPIFILLGTLLLDKRYTPWLTLAAILSLSLIGILQENGYLHISINTNDASNLVPIIIFLATGALIDYIILDNIHNNYRQIHDSEKELRHSYDLTIQGLSDAINMRDVDTGDHSHRVAEMTEKLARTMGYPESDMLFLRYGAFLHDIGKIGIQDHILFKPSPLDETEMNIMHRHCLLAEQILLRIPYLKPAISIPKHHHEHWDGNGYPDHLKGKDIPLAARIFAVVDVWDALTHDRPYRKACSKEMAYTYISERSGTQFDPEVAEIFLRLIT